MLRLSTSFCYNKGDGRQASLSPCELKQTLLDAAVALIAEVGPQAFTLREVARRAGVSHNAPYRHFDDKEDLLAAVAAQGFDRLTESMQKAMAKGRTAAERLELAGQGYVQFALNWPQHLLVMFDTPTPRTHETKPEYAARCATGFSNLARRHHRGAGGGRLTAGRSAAVAVVAWSGVHGLAKLAISGRLPFGAKQTAHFAGYLTQVLSEGMASVQAPVASGGRPRG